MNQVFESLPIIENKMTYFFNDHINIDIDLLKKDLQDIQQKLLENYYFKDDQREINLAFIQPYSAAERSISCVLF